MKSRTVRVLLLILASERTNGAISIRWIVRRCRLSSEQIGRRVLLLCPNLDYQLAAGLPTGWSRS
jgi:hypothetical protein